MEYLFKDGQLQPHEFIGKISKKGIAGIYIYANGWIAGMGGIILYPIKESALRLLQSASYKVGHLEKSPIEMLYRDSFESIIDFEGHFPSQVTIESVEDMLVALKQVEV